MRSEVFLEAWALEPCVSLIDRGKLDRLFDPRTRVVHKSVPSQDAFLRRLLRLRCIFEKVVFLSMLAHERWLFRVSLGWRAIFSRDSSLIWRLGLVSLFQIMHYLPLELLFVSFSVKTRPWSTNRTPRGGLAINLVYIVAIFLSLLLTSFAVTAMFAPLWWMLILSHIKSFDSSSEIILQLNFDWLFIQLHWISPNSFQEVSIWLSMNILSFNRDSWC